MYYYCFLNIVFIVYQNYGDYSDGKSVRTLTGLEICACICITFIESEEEASLAISEEAIAI